MPNRRPTNHPVPGCINDRSIVTVLEELTTDELSRLAEDVVLENRRRVEETQSLFEQLDQSTVEGTEDENLRYAYRLALVELKIYHELVRIVIDTLGYVPKVPLDSEVH